MEVFRVRSLAEAGEALVPRRPLLVLIDFDPPLVGAAEFLSRAKELLPDARFLILTGGRPPVVLRERTQAGLHFIAKPFELPALGLALQELLGKSNGQARRPSGSLRDLNLTDLIALYCLGQLTAVLKVEQSARRRGEIHFVRGQLRHAASGRLKGEDALQEMITWGSPRFSVIAERSEAGRTVQTGWMEILSEAIIPAVSPPEPTLAGKSRETPDAPPAPAGKKIVIVDDTETLRVFATEMLSAADPSLRITSTPDGMKGVAETAAVLPDLVLLDFSLPDINGDEVCRQLLANEKTSKIPVVMMSGHLLEMAATEARFENVVATLPKPFMATALVELVQKTLEDPPKFRRRSPAAVQSPPDQPAVKATPSAPRPVKLEEPERPAPRPAALKAAGVVVPLPAPAAVAPALSLSPQVIPFPSPPLQHPHTPARIVSARDSRVVVGLALEIVSMQFSPSLQMAAIRARPSSLTVALHVDPRALAGAPLPETGFELDRVDLDTRGQIQTMRLRPSQLRPRAIQPQTAMPIAEIAVLPSLEGRALQLKPSAGAPMKMQLLASFDLAGVELSANFTVSHLILKARGGKMRVSLQPEAANTGATFETAQVLLDRSARIAEILLDAVA